MKFSVSTYSLSGLVGENGVTEKDLVKIAKEIGFDGIEFADEYDDNLFKDTLHPFNCLIHSGIGAEYMGARLTLGYNLGVFNIMRKESHRSNLKTDGFFISVGYVFDFD